MAKKRKPKVKKKHVKQLKKLPIPILVVLFILIVGTAVVWVFYGDTIMKKLNPESPPVVDNGDPNPVNPIYSSDQNEAGFYYYNLEPAGGYYASANNLVGEALFLELRNIVQTGFNSVSYGDVRYVLAISDRDPNDETTVIGMYDDDKIANYWIGTGEGAWQREHVWPNSKLGIPRVNNNSKNIGSDLHNLRAITGINQTRSNRYFEAGEGGPYTIETDAFYPGDDHKGDVARILFYMIVMYPELNLTNIIEDLVNNPDTNYTPEGAFMGKKDLLLKWHKEDPVSELERQRNDFIYSGIATDPNGNDIAPQGNRNPFIDHPEYVHLIWEEKTIDELTKTETTSYTVLFYYRRETFYSSIQ